jgi:PAS domain S-box-containing protein
MPDKSHRLVSIFLLFLLLIGTVSIVFSLSSETRFVLKESVQNNLMSVAGIAASEIDGDALARLQPGDEGTRDFIRIRDQLRDVRSVSSDIRYIYTMRMSGDAVEFVVDADYGSDTDSPGIGYGYSPAPPELLAGFFGPSADSEFTTDQWGTVLSGYYPVRNSAGAVVGIVGVDMDSSKVLANLDRINLFLYVIALLLLFLITAGIIAIEYQGMKNEQLLRESEEKFKALFENAGAAIIIIDQDSILDCNHKTELMFGSSRDAIISRPPAQYSPERQPDGSHSTKKAREYMKKALMGEPQFFEWAYTRYDGTPFIAEVSLNRFMLQGRYYVQAIVQDISERKKADAALKTVTKKLTLLNAITFNEIRNTVFALNGYLSLERSESDRATLEKYLAVETDLVKRITKSLTFAQSYQDLGATSPHWHNVNQVFLMAISHLDLSHISRSVSLDNLEIFADPLLERVFYSLADNVLRHAESATEISVGYEQRESDLLIFFEDNGNGIATPLKEKIFTWGTGRQQGMELFLAREVLSITGITIRETGTEGKGARFELIVPRGAFRFM